MCLSQVCYETKYSGRQKDNGNKVQLKEEGQ